MMMILRTLCCTFSRSLNRSNRRSPGDTGHSVTSMERYCPYITPFFCFCCCVAQSGSLHELHCAEMPPLAQYVVMVGSALLVLGVLWASGRTTIGRGPLFAKAGPSSQITWALPNVSWLMESTTPSPIAVESGLKPDEEPSA